MSKKKSSDRKKPDETPVITGHDCRAEIRSESKGRSEKRDSDAPDGVSGNWS